MGRRVEDWIEGYLNYTDNTEPPIIYRRWVAISTLASVLQRKCYIDLGMVTFYPNFYIILVGPPAARKGTAMAPGQMMLKDIGIPLAADEASRQKLVNSLVEVSVVEPVPEGTITHASLTVISSELTVFLGYQNVELLGILCKWFDCETHFRYETIGRGVEEVANVWVNLIGGTTPTLLQAALPEEAVGSGFTSRVIFIFARDKGKIVIVPSLTKEQEELQENLLLDLSDIRGMYGKFVLTENALALYSHWRMQSEDGPLFNDSHLVSYEQRRPGHLLKLGVVHSASRGEDKVVHENDLAKAILILEEAERHMPEVFQGIGMNPLASVQLRLQTMLEVRGGMSMADVHRAFFNDANNTQLGEIIATLEAMGVCVLDTKNKRLIYRGSET